MKPFGSKRHQKSTNFNKRLSSKIAKSPVSYKVGESSSSNEKIILQYEVLSLEEKQSKIDNPECSGTRNKRRSSPYQENEELSSSESDNECNTELDNSKEPVRAFIGTPSANKNKSKKIHKSFKKVIKNDKLKHELNLDSLPVDAQEPIINKLEDKDKVKLFFVSIRYLNVIKSSGAILKRFTLRVDKNNFERFAVFTPFHEVPLRNISFDFKGFTNFRRLLEFLKNYDESVEHLCIQYAKFKNFYEFSQLCGNLKRVKSLSFQNCGIDQSGLESLSILPTLESISFEKCNDNIYKAFIKQNSLTKIQVQNDDWTWNGFPHETFNEICKNCKNFDHLVLKGAGTGSYFDSDEFPFKIKKLETSMITFHWYVGIKTERVSFLRSQRGDLKELTIQQLPNDFDGGRVLKYIFAEMNLDTFYYGKIPLILNGKKQEVEEFAATEIQIRSALELIEQFPSITSYCLILSATDIASDEIEKVINPRNDFYRQLRKFEVIDNSRYRGLFGVFLGLLKNLVNIEILSLKTQDRNINVLLEESLPHMPELKELYLPSMVPRGKERLKIVKTLAPGLKKLSIADQFVAEAKEIFDQHVEICGISQN